MGEAGKPTLVECGRCGSTEFCIEAEHLVHWEAIKQGTSVVDHFWVVCRNCDNNMGHMEGVVKCESTSSTSNSFQAK
jgi:hypothetical protein